MSLCLRAPIRRSIVACLALVTLCSLFFLSTLNVQASTVTINDQAGVLDAGRIQAEAAKLPVPVFIYTTKTFTGGQDALNESTRAQLPDQDTIAIGIDTVHRHFSIEAGTNVYLSNSQTSDALSAFQSHYNRGDYTVATIAAIDSIYNALSGGGSSENGMTPFGVAVAIFLGIAVVVVILFAIRRRRGGSGNIPGPSETRAERELSYFGGVYPIGHPPSGNYGGGVGANVGGGFGGGASGGFGGGSTGGGAGGSF